jgi:hypothetical protein
MCLHGIIGDTLGGANELRAEGDQYSNVMVEELWCVLE